MRKCSGSNEKGLTLVEVLAALVILGILFVGIMTIFPQMTLFNEKTEAKLDTMNLARQEMAAITAQDKWERLLVPGTDVVDATLPDFLQESKVVSEMELLNYTLDPNVYGDYIKFIKNDSAKGYRYEADIYKVCEKFLNETLIGTEEPPEGSCEKLDRVKLYKVHLKIFNLDTGTSGSGQLSSETFSFVPYRAYKEEVIESPGG
ncbi:type II secretion system protein [Planomicrobium okeanokoites]|uniref:type IV pilus modification PilV family protein n=1 Tax=Planomicrobium okeanokoites TaxID=244 RepID=UPI0030F664EB